MFKTEFKTTPMEGRFAWCYLGKPRTEDMNGKKLEKERYECAFYFPKTAADPQQCRNYRFFADIAWEVVANVYRGTWPMIDPQSGRWIDWPVDDCDVPAIRDKYPWSAGMWRVGLSGGMYPVKVFDPGNNQIEKGVDGKFRPGTFKGDDGVGGDWGLASVNAYEWNFGSRRGVSFGCEGIKVTRLDEQIGGGGRSGEQMFGAPTGQPVYGAAPPQPAPPPLPQGYAPPQQPQGQWAVQGVNAPPQPGYAPNPPQGGPYAPIPGAPAYPTPQVVPQPYAAAAYAPGAPAPLSNGGYPPGPTPQPSPYAPGMGGPAPATAPGPYAPPPTGTGNAVYPSSAPQPYAPPQGGMPPQPPMSGGFAAPPQAPAYAPPMGTR